MLKTIINHFYSHDNWKKCMRPRWFVYWTLSEFQFNVYIKTSSAVPQSWSHHLNLDKVYYLVFLSLFISLISLVLSISVEVFWKWMKGDLGSSTVIYSINIPNRPSKESKKSANQNKKIYEKWFWISTDLYIADNIDLGKWKF